MFDNIAAKLKGLARFICLAGIVVSAISAFVMISVRIPSLIAVYLGVLGAVASWVLSWVVYAFGDIVDDMKTLVKQNETRLQMAAEQAKAAAAYTLPEPQAETVNDASAVKSADSKKGKRSTDVKTKHADWIDLGNQAVKCPKCGEKMTIDYIRARKKCPTCGCKYSS